MANRNKKTSRSKRKESWEDRESRDERRDSKRGRRSEGTNDPRWYATDPALLRDSSSIPFSWPIGTDINYDIPVFGNNLTKLNERFTVPGICALELVPTFGNTDDLQSAPINVAATAMYSFVRHANSGHSNYDPNDLMLYVMAMTQCYSYINYLERVYGIAMMYDQRNRYMPDSLLQVQGIDPSSIKNNLADFRYAINVLINKISCMAVPATMTIFLRQAMLYAFIYGEGASIKDQLYLYFPRGFYKFDLDANMAGCLVFERLTKATLNTWQDLITYGEDMFDRIWSQEDFGIMSGDVLKAYGNGILSLSSLAEDTMMSPVFDPMVLHQMKNATVQSIEGVDGVGTPVTIFQDINKQYLDTTIHTLYGNLPDGDTCSAEIAISTMNKVLTLDTDNPTPDLVIEATRLMTGYRNIVWNGLGQANYATLECGSEICIEAHMVRIDQSGNFNDTTYKGARYTVANVASSLVAFINRAALVKCFKYAPTIYETLYNDATDAQQGKLAQVFPVAEIDNYAVLSPQDIGKQHMAAILNMLNVPNIAKVSR